jgi:hypothetical protein
MNPRTLIIAVILIFFKIAKINFSRGDKLITGDYSWYDSVFFSLANMCDTLRTFPAEENHCKTNIFHFFRTKAFALLKCLVFCKKCIAGSGVVEFRFSWYCQFNWMLFFHMLLRTWISCSRWSSWDDGRRSSSCYWSHWTPCCFS